MAAIDENDERPAKRTRLETIFDKFHTFHNKDTFSNEYRGLCSDRSFSLISHRITYCDANCENGKTFSRATCRAKPVIEALYPFGSIFNKGVKILNDITENDGHIPDDNETRALFVPLLTYLFDEKSHECLRRIRYDAVDKTQLMITLGAHFFSKLAVSKSFYVDKHASEKGTICRCGDCKEKDILPLFDDTSIGHNEVWHGSLDIFLDGNEISVHLTPERENSPGLRGSVWFRELRSITNRDEALSQTITFSFLQQQRHPEMKHSLVPFISASNRAVQFFFYDPKNDILLESREFKFFVSGEELLLSYQTIIATWLVLNYKYLCSGPTKNILEAPKADFPKCAGSALEIYRSKLRFRNVGGTSKEEQHGPWEAIQAGRYDRLPFDWPKEPFTRRPVYSDKV